MTELSPYVGTDRYLSDDLLAEPVTDMCMRRPLRRSKVPLALKLIRDWPPPLSVVVGIGAGDVTVPPATDVVVQTSRPSLVLGDSGSQRSPSVRVTSSPNKPESL